MLFCSPVTGEISETSNPFGGAWFDATGFGTYYQGAGAWCFHTGVDLNLAQYADCGKPVYAAADGLIVFAGTVMGWQQSVVVIRHTLEGGSGVWTRYAHIRDIRALGSVRRGDPIGVIADYAPVGPKGDHLHFDVCLVDLGARPGDWPGMDKVRLVRTYRNPAAWLREHAK